MARKISLEVEACSFLVALNERSCTQWAAQQTLLTHTNINRPLSGSADYAHNFISMEYKDKSKFSSLEAGDTVKIRNSVYDHFDEAIVIAIVDEMYCVLDWKGSTVSRNKFQFNSEPILFCA